MYLKTCKDGNVPGWIFADSFTLSGHLEKSMGADLWKISRGLIHFKHRRCDELMIEMP